MLPPIIPEFMGRQRELEMLTEWFSREPSKPILIFGMGGIGKTATVRQFASRFDADKVSWWSFYERRDETVESLFERLFTEEPKLVVLDDVEHTALNPIPYLLEKVRQYHPSVHVILTSRYQIGSLDADLLAMEPLSREDSVSFLRMRTSGTEVQLEELANLLGNHPLALSVASGLFRTHPVTEVVERLQRTIYNLSDATAKPQELVIASAAPLVVSATDTLIERLRGQPRDIHSLPPRKFEEVIASLLDDMGMEVHLTQQTRDGGRDILAYLNSPLGRMLCLVEAKRYNPKRPVGVELVRTLYGTLFHEQANSAMMVTTSHFTPDAMAFQKQHAYQLSLKDFQDITDWIAKFKKRN